MKYRNIPVLILGYNRPKHIKKLITSLKKIKPKNIFISLDGPKKNETDRIKCHVVKNEIEKINWSCEIKKKYNLNNLGCRESVYKGINWFFKHNNFGIVLEDDCIPNISFFTFCEKINNKYKNNKKIFTISGTNFFNKKISNDYFFSKYNHCWGWGSWKRAWKYYDNNLSFWNNWKNTNSWKLLHQDEIERKYWEKIFNKTKKRKIDSWAYVWTCSVWKNNGLTVIPKKNLIKNIGFDIGATHTLEKKLNHLKAFSLKFKKNLIGPKILKPLRANDEYVFNNHFQGKYYLWPWVVLKVIKLFLENPKMFFLKANRVLFS